VTLMYEFSFYYNLTHYLATLVLYSLNIAHSLLCNGTTRHAIGHNVHIMCVSGTSEGCLILISLMHRVLRLNYLCHAYWRDPCPIF